MAKPAKNKRPQSKQSIAQAFLRNSPNWPIFALALIGMALTAYLTFSSWRGQLVAGCTVGSACDVVLSSRWSTLFGLPTSFWGFITYSLLATVAWNRRGDIQWKWAWLISIGGLLYSLYLTGVSFFVLEAACPYCLTSLALMASTYAVVLFQRPADLPHFSWGPWLAKSVGGALVVIIALHLHYAGYWGKTAAPEDPWIRGLAEHLARSQAKFYGASWCPHCTEQKESFGSSAHRLPYVECSPGGRRAPNAPECNEAGIKTYPTWNINGQRYTGIQSLENLSQYSQYKGVDP